MKTLKLSFLGVAFALFFVSCQSPTAKFIKEFSAFVEQVEQNHKAYSDNDAWDPIDTQLKEFMDQYKQMENQFSVKEKQAVDDLVKRYYTARVSDWKLTKVIKWAAERWDDINNVLAGFGVHFDICGLFQDILGIDVCSYVRVNIDSK